MSEPSYYFSYTRLGLFIKPIHGTVLVALSTYISQLYFDEFLWGVS